MFDPSAFNTLGASYIVGGLILVGLILLVFIVWLWLSSSQSSDSQDRPEPISAALIVGTNTANPDRFRQVWICPGESVGIAWGTQNADTANITPDLGDVSLQGQSTVSPSTTTIYTLNAEGAGGTATDQAAVVVITSDNDNFDKSLDAPPLDPDTGYPISLIWRGTLSSTFLSSNIRVTSVKLTQTPSDWPEWEFRKNNPDGSIDSFNASLDEETSLATPFVAVGEWEATPINTSADPFVRAQGSVGISLTFICRA